MATTADSSAATPRSQGAAASTPPPPPGAERAPVHRSIIDMLCCRSVDVVEARRRNKEVEDMVAKGAQEDEKEIKLLLLGAGESGKSTIFKQFEIIYGRGFTEEQRRDYRKYIWGNVVETIQTLAVACADLGFAEEVVCRPAFDVALNLDPMESKTPSVELAQTISALWAEDAVQKTWAQRSRLQVFESASTFLAKVEDIAQDEYVPTVDDMLLSRVRTTGIVEAHYDIDGTYFTMLDVGGQRNERRKWYHQFDNVTGIIFVAALSEYDQVLFEDESTNRMVEATALFNEIINSVWFSKMSLILFLNKNDLFSIKVQQVNIGDVEPFSDYSGQPYSYEEGVQYFLGKFMSCNSNPEERDIYHHITNATNSSNIAFVLNACKEIILRDNIALAGFDSA